MTASDSLDSIFFNALQEPNAARRTSYLDQACGDNVDLRQMLERLIDAHLRAGDSFLERPAVGLESESEAEQDNAEKPLAGTRELEQDARSQDAGRVATYGPNTAVVGGQEHSVLKSIGKQLGKSPPTVVLREDSLDSHLAENPRSSEIPQSTAELRYQVHGEIARGGMGAILKGRDTDLGRDLAIKVLLDSHKQKPEYIQRFVEEAQIGGQLQHPGIVPVYELGQFEDQRPFFSMKLVKGETLAALLAKRRSPQEDLPKLLGIFEQICQTMAYAHSKGVIHRDLKPANIMVGAFGEVQVMDWGLSKVLRTGGVADEEMSLRKHRDATVIQTRRSAGSDGFGSDGVSSVGSDTRHGSIMGTLAYMPPEQALGEVDLLDTRADVFGLGAILAEILTGKPAYVGETREIVSRLASRGKLDDCYARLDASGTSPELCDIARQALAPEVEDRLSDANTLSERITGYLEGVQNRLKQAELDKVEAQARSEEERRRKKLYLAIAALLLLATTSVAFAYQRSAEASRVEAKAIEQRFDDEQKHASELEKQKDRLAIERLLATSRAIEGTKPIQKLLLTMEALKGAVEIEGISMRGITENFSQLVANIGGTPLTTLDGRGGLRASQYDRLLIGASLGNSIQLWDASHSPPELINEFELSSDKKKIWSSDISDDGRTVVVGGFGVVQVWHLSEDGREVLSNYALPLPRLSDGQRIKGQVMVRINPDGSAVVMQAGPIFQLWKLGETKGALAPRFSIGAATDSIHSSIGQAAYSHDGNWLALLQSDSNKLRLWNLGDTATSAPTELQKMGAAGFAVFSPDNERLVVAADNGVVCYDLRSDDIAANKLMLVRRKVRTIAFDPTGKWLLVGQALFDLESESPFEAVALLNCYGTTELGARVHPNFLASSFSPDGKKLFTGGVDCLIHVWELDADYLSTLPKEDTEFGGCAVWNPLARPEQPHFQILAGHEDRVSGLHVTTNGEQLISTSWDGTGRLWDLQSENPGSSAVVDRHANRVLEMAFSPDGRWLVSGSEDQTAHLHRLNADGVPTKTYVLAGLNDGVRTLKFSSDSRWLVTAPGKLPFLSPHPSGRQAILWDLTRADPTQTPRVLGGHALSVTYALFSPDNRWLATLGFDGEIRLWDMGDPGRLKPRILAGHKGGIPSVDFSADERYLASGGLDGAALLWDLSQPDPIEPRKLLQSQDWVLGIGLLGDQTHMVTSKWQRPTYLWSSKLSGLAERIANDNSSFEQGAIYIERGLIIPYVVEFEGNRMRVEETLWRLDTGDKLESHLHDDHVSRACWSADRRMLASTGEDRTVRVSRFLEDGSWDETIILRGHQYQTAGIAISPDNNLIASGDVSGEVRLWDVDIERLLARAQQLAGRELTEVERKNLGLEVSP